MSAVLATLRAAIDSAPQVIETTIPQASAVPSSPQSTSAEPESKTGTPGDAGSSSTAESSPISPSTRGGASTVPDAPGKRLAPAAVAAGCQTYPPTTFQVCGRIRDKYNQTGGPTGFLLFPKSNELTNPGNTGKRSEFLGGNIYWSTATDAHPVAHDFLTKWGEKGYEAGFMKYPTTDEVVLSDGRRQEFQGASIYWSALTGAHNVQVLIRDKWRDIGAESGDFKYPTTDETTTPDGIGRYNSFQGGAVYWSPSTGAQPVTGAIYALWAADNWEAGKWGYPVAAQYTEGSSIKQQFQGGVITIGGENPVKDTINGCTMNQEWPHQSHHQPDTVDAPFSVNCTNDQRSIKADTRFWYYADQCGYIRGAIGGCSDKAITTDFTYSKPKAGTGPVRSLTTGPQRDYPAPAVPCKNGQYFVTTTFTVTGTDGKSFDKEHRTNMVHVNTCDD